MVRFLVTAAAMLLCSGFLLGDSYKTILSDKDKQTEEGYVFSNTYCQMAFLNPSLHSGRITTGDFEVMPRQDVRGKFTLDEDEAKLRIFFKPAMKVFSLGGRRRPVHGEGNWSLVKAPGGVKFSRFFTGGLNSVQADLSVVMDKKTAQIFFDLTLENNGNSECNVEFNPLFSFLRNDVTPLDLSVQRSVVRYVDGKRAVVFCNEQTVLDGDSQHYWWRRVARDHKDFLNYFNRERIPFNHARLVPPGNFALTGLVGKASLVWDMQQSKLAKLEIGWEGVHAEATPVWSINVKPGEKQQIKFRMLTLRGLNRVDLIKDDWVFGYATDRDLLNIQSVPLQPRERLAIIATVTNSRNGQVMINQRSELVAMSPLQPGKMEWRAPQQFQSGASYAIKVSMVPVDSSKALVEVSGNIIQ